jgi:hypothetical protein
MAIFVYADETIFTTDKAENNYGLGCGVFVSSKEITQEIVDEALYNLEKDNDFDNNQDSRTVERRYFHASDDSKNAHSHFCNSVNKNVVGIFDYTYFDNIKSINRSQKGFYENIFNQCLNGSSMELFESTDEVFLTIEKRNTLSEEMTLKWLNILYKLYEGTAYTIPTYKTYYPKINIALKGKKEPGLQVVDFLIWSLNRTKAKIPDDRWHKRVKYRTWHYYKDLQNQNRGKYYLNTYPKDFNLNEEYPFKFEEPREWESFLNAYINIERFLTLIEKSDFTEKSIHLYDNLISVSTKLKLDKHHLTEAEIALVGSVFLRLFDTLPLYKHIQEDDRTSWTLLLQAKYLASILVRNDQRHFNRIRRAILKWRHFFSAESPVSGTLTEAVNMSKII